MSARRALHFVVHFNAKKWHNGHCNNQRFTHIGLSLKIFRSRMYLTPCRMRSNLDILICLRLARDLRTDPRVTVESRGR